MDSLTNDSCLNFHKLVNNTLPQSFCYIADRELHTVREYWGIQRSGKSTLLVRDLLTLWSAFPDFEIYTNFILCLPSNNLHILNNDNLIESVLKLKRDKKRHIILAWDELSQVFGGRTYSSKIQIEIASFLWQMPKRDFHLFFTSNPGNSVDLIIRLATWFTIMCKYTHGLTRDLDIIHYRI